MKQKGHGLTGPEQAFSRARGQMSLEALISFAALLAALSILIFSAGRLSRDFSSSVEASARLLALSDEALMLDTAGFCLSGASVYQNISSGPSEDGWRILPAGGGHAGEPLFNRVSRGFDGKTYVQGKNSEPV